MDFNVTPTAQGHIRKKKRRKKKKKKKKTVGKEEKKLHKKDNMRRKPETYKQNTGTLHIPNQPASGPTGRRPD